VKPLGFGVVKPPRCQVSVLGIECNNKHKQKYEKS